MRLEILLFTTAAVAALIPRCDTGDATSSVDISATAAPTVTSSTLVRAVKSKKTKKKTPATRTVMTTTILPSRAVSVEQPACTPHSICADYINACGKRYGGCFDENYCDGNTSPFPIPACPTPLTKKRRSVEPPVITPV